MPSASGQRKTALPLAFSVSERKYPSALSVSDEVEGRPVYPGQRAPLQFVLTVDATITSRMRRVVLTMERPQTSADVAAVRPG
ncbi:hypothetical protein [Mesorhizobium sp. M1E.F.Ca.ET.063.01.1.1]|uniref:hypothetical protein n=1 Tax=Mesorhizobium sp. M1E.F.Ca.ET.063.01.1.1 TaxID=2496750 RepID=UPI001671A006|nr:hypothetical protein [Mesorhizobium sp. M1E.F.Ca.ET.063.01.1.1]